MDRDLQQRIAAMSPKERSDFLRFLNVINDKHDMGDSETAPSDTANDPAPTAEE